MHAKRLIEKESPIRPSRGEILDRHGYPLVTKIPAFRIGLILSYYMNDEDRDEKLKILSKQIHVSYKECKRRIKAGYNLWKKKKILNPYRAEITLKQNASKDEAIWIKERMNTDDYSWIRCEEKEQRFYKLGKNLAHVLGFVSSIDPDTYSKKSNDRYEGRSIYRLDSEIGQIGIEYQLDRLLRGVYGIRYEQVNAKGRILIKEIPGSTVNPIHGNNVKLCIDKNIQKAAYRAIRGLQDKNGAVIVTRPATGEVLAMVSNPSFNANSYNRDFLKLIQDEKKPLINRVYQTLTPPGSIFKLVVAASALESRKWSPRRTNTCSGVYYMPRDRSRHPYHCMGVHGTLDLLHAIKKSCNCYFYNLGYTIGWDTVHKYGHAFGLGEKTGLDFGLEAANFFPSKSDVSKFKFTDKKGRKYNYRWQYGDTVVASIGQGFVLLTPLQIHNIVSLIANNGNLMKPYVIQKITNPNTNKLILDVNPKDRYFDSDIKIRKKTVRFLQKAMSNVTTQGGTAYWFCGRPFRDQSSSYIIDEKLTDELIIAGKTGTCQNPDSDVPHALFTSFAPYNCKNPLNRIAITVFVEHGGTGGANASPIAAAIYNYIFNSKDDERSVEYFYTKKLHLEYKATEEEIEDQLNKDDEEVEEMTDDIINKIMDYNRLFNEVTVLENKDEEIEIENPEPADDDEINKIDKKKPKIKIEKQRKLKQLEKRKKEIEKLIKEKKIKADTSKIIPDPKLIDKNKTNKNHKFDKDHKKPDKNDNHKKPDKIDNHKKPDKNDELLLKAPLPNVDIENLRTEISDFLDEEKTKEHKKILKEIKEKEENKTKSNEEALKKLQKEEMKIKPDTKTMLGGDKGVKKVKEIKEREEKKALQKFEDKKSKDNAKEKDDKAPKKEHNDKDKKKANTSENRKKEEKKKDK